ncbi:hypothetical protein ACFFKH_22225 [Micromonospora marina]|uniref:hypothetical protein n=1 Tax=Micromonospora marina TaxID=307120 RepID=UPI00114C912B
MILVIVTHRSVAAALHLRWDDQPLAAGHERAELTGDGVVAVRQCRDELVRSGGPVPWGGERDGLDSVVQRVGY